MASVSANIFAGVAAKEGFETTHAQPDACNAVAYTTTLNLSYGSKIVVRAALLNNEMDDFSAKKIVRTLSVYLEESECNITGQTYA